MLFCYSPDALQDNWLHEVLTETLQAGMDRIDQGLQVVAWPKNIPLDRRDALSSRTGLRDRLIEFFEAYDALALVGRVAVRNAMTSQNSFPDLFNGEFPCARLSDLPETVRLPIKNMFQFAFDLLTPIGLRDIHYKKLYEKVPARICPFCGVENLEAPVLPREDFDHYLPISSYPFAGSNLRNLSPMGARCNKSFKLKLDVTIDDNTGLKRRCSDPYNGPSFEVSLTNSQPFEGDVIDYLPCPAWKIDFMGADAEAAATWNSVFRISDRYKNSHLNPDFRGWIAHFAEWCRVLKVPVTNNVELQAALKQYTDATIQEGFADRAFLKRAVFTMLRERCSDDVGGVRLVAWLVDLVQLNA